MFLSRKLWVNCADLSVPMNNDNVATNVAKTVNIQIYTYQKYKHKIRTTF